MIKPIKAIFHGVKKGLIMFNWILRLYHLFIPCKNHKWKYRGWADGGLAGIVYLYRCVKCGEKKVEY